MKTTEKTFDAVKFMRQQRDKLSEKLAKMTKKEILEYFRKRKARERYEIVDRKLRFFIKRSGNLISKR